VIRTSTNGSSLAEVLDRVLDKGIVIDAFVRVSLVGIELLAIEARIVIASVERWLEYAEAVGLTRRHSGSSSSSSSLVSDES
jgi:hypothetical protein